MNHSENEASRPALTDEDWISLGKSDAWEGKPKQSPEHDVRAASLYDLGYSEGEISRSPIDAEK